MADIELMKKHLTSEKVFYNLNWHELVREDTPTDSGVEITTPLNSRNSSSKQKRRSSTFRKRRTNKTLASSSIMLANEKNGSLSRSTSFLEEKQMFELCKTKYQTPLDPVSANESSILFPKKCWAGSFLLHILNCFNSKPKCLSTEASNEYIQEIENIEPNSNVDIKPPIDILYNIHRIVLLLYISGVIENLKICFDPDTKILTVSGYKLPYENFTEHSFIYHEIKEGYFKRSFLLKKSIMECDISHSHEQGVIKIDIPFKQEECQEN